MSYSIHLSLLAIIVVAVTQTTQKTLNGPRSQEKMEAASVDCGPVGVFNNNEPFDSLPLPRCPDDRRLNVVLRLYTRDDPTIGRVITRTSIPSSFSNNRQTWFFTHGFLTEETRNWLTDFKIAALQQGDYNVVGVEWDAFDDYFQSTSDTRTIGAEIALISKLLVDNGLPRSNLYCVGHSLGAHVCSFAGKAYKFGRITGMDPAGPWFDWWGFRLYSVGLEPNDADRVDIIHTDTILLGTGLNRGHQDFYPSAIPLVSHGFAIDLFISSVRQPRSCFIADLIFSSKQCSMGFYANECNDRGEFNILVSPLPPWCRIFDDEAQKVLQ